VWTPKRVLILVAGLCLFATGYAIYSYFLGGIDGLPPLPPELQPQVGYVDVPGTATHEADRRLELAFGPGCEEMRRPLRLLLRDKGVVLSTGEVKTDEPDGRIKLSPFSAAMFPKNKGEGFPEINTVQSEYAYLTLDRPVSNFAMELSNRKVTKVELRGRDIILVNNRRSPHKSDDLEVRISRGLTRPDEDAKATLVYDELRDLIWSDDLVKLLDIQSQPHPTEITANGMELKLVKDANRPKDSKPRTENAPGVEQLLLRSSVDMHLWVDANSGFLANTQDFGKQEAARAKKGAAEKALVVIRTAGPFTYDLTKDLAWFDAPTRPANTTPTSPDEVTVLRKNRHGQEGEKIDQLVCHRLELQFRKKAAGPRTGPRDSTTGDKEIETAHASSRKDKDVVLTMDTENLEAYGSELFYRAPTAGQGPQTIISGSPMRAVKDGHKIVARDLHLCGPNTKGEGQQARALGPGRIDLFDRGNPQRPYPNHAVWRDVMTAVKDKDGDQIFDLLTFTGAASFVDEERDQTLNGERMQVWLQQNRASADTPAPGSVQAGNVTKQKLHRVIAQDKVKAVTAEMIIRHTNRLTITFLPEVARDDRLPEVAAITTAQRPVQAPAPEVKTLLPEVKTLLPEVKTPAPTTLLAVVPVEDKKAGPRKKQDKPIELTADEVVLYVTTLGTKKELQEMKAEGSVHVVQEGELPGEKKVEILGQLVNLVHHPQGDTLFVYSEPGKWAQLDLGKLKMLGPKIVINQRENIAEVDGQGAMTLPPSDKNFDGTQPTRTMVGQPEHKLTIHWNKSMIFRGKDADFYGGVQAYQDGSRLRCQDLSVTFDRFVSLKEGQKGGQGAKVDQLLCNLRVFAVDEKKEDGEFVHGSIIEGTQLESFNPEGKTNVSGPGVVRHLAFGNGNLNQKLKPPGPATSQKDDVLKLTRIEYASRMHSVNQPTGKTARFYGQVNVYHFPAESYDATMDPNRPPKDGFFMQCELLSVQTRPFGNRSHQLMVAEHRVYFRTEEFVGYCDVLKYDEAKEHIVFEAKEGNLVRLFKRAETQGGKPSETSGKVILYNRRTGEFTFDKANNFRSSQRAVPRVPLAWADPSKAQGRPSLGLAARAHVDLSLGARSEGPTTITAVVRREPSACRATWTPVSESFTLVGRGSLVLPRGSSRAFT
jgi:hypothetical protein